MKDGLITLQIGGKERTLKFNMRALETFSEVKNGSTASVSSAVLLVYAGLIGFAYANQIQPDFTFSNVVDWVENLVFDGKLDEIKAVDKCFSESRAFAYFSKQAEDAKKKTAQVGMTSTHMPGGSSDLPPGNTMS